MRIVILPKTKYVRRAEPINRREAGNACASRAAYYKHAHVRRLPEGWKANPDHVALGRSLGFRIDDGSTFVVDFHTRGEVSKTKILYRSRTAIEILFGPPESDEEES